MTNHIKLKMSKFKKFKFVDSHYTVPAIDFIKYTGI